MFSDEYFDNYIANITNYISTRVSEDYGLSIAQSINLLVGSETYLKLTDITDKYYQLPLQDMVELFEQEIEERSNVK
jgi:hypothetical protein